MVVNINDMGFWIDNKICPQCGLNLSEIEKYTVKIVSTQNRKIKNITLSGNGCDIETISDYFKSICLEKLKNYLPEKEQSYGFKLNDYNHNTHRIIVIKNKTNLCFSFYAGDYTTEEVHDAIYKILFEKKQKVH